MSSEVILMRKVESSETKAVQSGQNSYQSCLGGGSNYNKKVLELGYSKRTSTYAPAFAILLLQFAIHVHICYLKALENVSLSFFTVRLNPVNLSLC